MQNLWTEKASASRFKENFFKGLLKMSVTPTQKILARVDFIKGDYKAVIGSDPELLWLAEKDLLWLTEAVKELSHATEDAMEHINCGNSVSAHRTLRTALAKVADTTKGET
jgi:hypothetical protein